MGSQEFSTYMRRRWLYHEDLGEEPAALALGIENLKHTGGSGQLCRLVFKLADEVFSGCPQKFRKEIVFRTDTMTVDVAEKLLAKAQRLTRHLFDPFG